MFHDPGDEMGSTEAFPVHQQVVPYLVKNGSDRPIKGANTNSVWSIVLKQENKMRDFLLNP